MTTPSQPPSHFICPRMTLHFKSRNCDLSIDAITAFFQNLDDHCLIQVHDDGSRNGNQLKSFNIRFALVSVYEGMLRSGSVNIDRYLFSVDKARETTSLILIPRIQFRSAEEVNNYERDLNHIVRNFFSQESRPTNWPSSAEWPPLYQIVPMMNSHRLLLNDRRPLQTILYNLRQVQDDPIFDVRLPTDKDNDRTTLFVFLHHGITQRRFNQEEKMRILGEIESNLNMHLNAVALTLCPHLGVDRPTLVIVLDSPAQFFLHARFEGIELHFREQFAAKMEESCRNSPINIRIRNENIQLKVKMNHRRGEERTQPNRQNRPDHPNPQHTPIQRAHRSPPASLTTLLNPVPLRINLPQTNEIGLRLNPTAQVFVPRSANGQIRTMPEVEALKTYAPSTLDQIPNITSQTQLPPTQQLHNDNEAFVRHTLSEEGLIGHQSQIPTLSRDEQPTPREESTMDDHSGLSDSLTFSLSSSFSTTHSSPAATSNHRKQRSEIDSSDSESVLIAGGDSESVLIAGGDSESVLIAGGDSPLVPDPNQHEQPSGIDSPYSGPYPPNDGDLPFGFDPKERYQTGETGEESGDDEDNSEFSYSRLPPLHQSGSISDFSNISSGPLSSRGVSPSRSPANVSTRLSSAWDGQSFVSLSPSHDQNPFFPPPLHQSGSISDFSNISRGPLSSRGVSPSRSPENVSTRHSPAWDAFYDWPLPEDKEGASIDIT
ncbi:hypothetical protein BLNAU_1407 [Blattamonas nauphoetae]|uniref:Uncharacterized protein n=1 Tax=Blattamonas nauphoetae TaxID=2049346 RepID=A0ABQ9YJC7_9EUKA|nr:hypothetical protein BLNAU_1407 [Blattamonas nauphoetae]